MTMETEGFIYGLFINIGKMVVPMLASHFFGDENVLVFPR